MVCGLILLIVMVFRGSSMAFLHMTNKPKSPISPKFQHISSLNTGLKTFLYTIPSTLVSSTRTFASSNLVPVPIVSSNTNNIIIKSPIDEREYKAITLKNGMQVLLISDPDTLRGAAALDVHVGSFCDPVDIPGLAHFCEHMLFLGNKKYPKEDEYSKFLSTHGGTSNAYTSSEDTCFYFDVNAEYLKPALDRFAQFFISPLFTESSTSRELNAVDSEHSKNLNNDGFRYFQLEKSTANPLHPNARFPTGNKETLEKIPKSRGINVRDALLKYHSEFYSANVMTLAILGKDSITELETIATNLFSPVPTTHRPVPELSWWGKVPPFLPQQAAESYEIVPVGETRRLQLTWHLWIPTPEERHILEHTKPETILTSLVGHETQGSLRSYLVSKGWINALQASISNDFADCTTFDVAVDLTQEGFKHRNDIVRAVFGYLDMLRKDGIPRYIYAEVMQLSKMQFDYAEKSEPSNFVSTVVADMQIYKNPAEYLTGSRIAANIDEKQVLKYLQRLTPQQCRVKLISNDFKGKTKLQEPIYKTEYNKQELTRETKEWGEVNSKDYPFHIPPKNELIPTNFDLIGTLPLKIDKKEKLAILNEPPKEVSAGIDASRWTLWHKLDRSFRIPKLYAVMSFAVPSSKYDASFLLRAKLFDYCFMDDVSEYLYDANLAGLSFSLEFTSKGVQIILSGYNDKLPLFAEQIVAKLKAYKPNMQSFSRYKDVLSREIKAWKTLQPYQHVAYYASLATETLQFPNDQLASVLETLKASDLGSFLDVCLESSYGTALIMGNVDEIAAKKLLNIFDKAYPFTPLDTSLRSKRDVKLIPHSSISDRIGYKISNIEPNINDENSAVTFYYQLPTRDIQSTSHLEVLSEALEESFYNSLRTQQQLGYIVFSGLRFREGVYSLVFTVQSSVYNTNEITKRILAYVDKSIGDINQMSQDTFDSYKEGIISRKLEPDQRLTSQASRFWSEIILSETSGEPPHFNRNPEEAELIRQFKLPEFRTFAFEVLSPQGKLNHVLVSEVHSQKNKTVIASSSEQAALDRFVLIPDPMEFMASSTSI